MDVSKPDPTDLPDRRRRAGASVEAMAAGIGLTADEIREIEAGKAPPDKQNYYVTWLARIEGWSADKRAEQLLAAIDSGRRFVV
jgi:ribosome-binding protein aMBF1 (putative translation factor)